MSEPVITTDTKTGKLTIEWPDGCDPNGVTEVSNQVIEGWVKKHNILIAWLEYACETAEASCGCTFGPYRPFMMEQLAAGALPPEEL